MTSAEAIEFLRPAVDPRLVAWVDFGAGSGTFTEALAHILGPNGAVLAVDNDPVAIRRLRGVVGRLPAGAASVEVVRGDLEDLSRIPELERGELQGALLANVLHFFRQPERILGAVASRLGSRGRVVVVEYGNVSANRWVPYPIPAERLRRVASSAGFESMTMVAERPSQFGGRLYCAVLESRGDSARPARHRRASGQ